MAIRHSGILLHLTSLPSPYGVGTLGREAYNFADFLASAGQRSWQVLPLGPIGDGNSPYHTMSAFAGSPLLIDPDLLEEDGLLLPGEADDIFWGSDPEHVDFPAVIKGRDTLLRLAVSRFLPNDDYRAFLVKESEWLDDWALYCALRTEFGAADWTQWPDEYRLRREDALQAVRAELADEIYYHCVVQYLFYRQWDAFRAYLRKLDIHLIGDIPIYVPLDSADVWAHPEQFRLDPNGHPDMVAGVPPDYFSEDGQLWGNPLYNWDTMRDSGFHWWVTRLQAAARLFDTVRIDHFRGLASYWAVPAYETTANNGRWMPGPGQDFIDTVRYACPGTDFIAEDLGILTQDVHELHEYTGWPGMKILLFAFDAGPANLYLPHRYERNCICYTGTHDNETLMQWWQELSDDTRAFARAYMGLNKDEGIAEGVIRTGMASIANTFICPMQDWLQLGADARMNTPGQASGCWSWRMLPDAASLPLAMKILALTQRYGR